MRYTWLLVLLLIPFAAAEAGKIHVLTVSTDTDQGGIAEVYLEVRPGTGRLFIDSFPLTKLDTQISTRFAREYACSLSERDCSQLDFFYIIRAPSTIVAGPSAGAAITVLTYAQLEDLKLHSSTVMTGTINSGGLVGPVGGTDEKIGAATAEGFTRVLLPVSQFNASRDYETEVLPVSDVEEAILLFTGVDVRPEVMNISPPDEYYVTMEEVMTSLCSRADQLATVVGNVSNSTQSQLDLATEASANGKYYTAASFCFGANLQLRREMLRDKSQNELRRIHRQLREDILLFDRSLPEEFTTIADLEVYMIVRERLIDASDTLESLDYENLSSNGVAYALERYNSAQSWSAFLGVLPSKELDLSEQQLQSSCYAKLGEADERLTYVQYVLQRSLSETRLELDNAYEDERQGEWELCIFKASKAKAEADALLSALYSGNDYNASVQRKIEKAGEVLGRQSARGNFPLLAFSYYEYASNLDDPFSASLYAEYAVELASLDIYFEPRPVQREYDQSRMVLLVGGLAVGFFAGVLAAELFERHKRRKKRRKK